VDKDYVHAVELLQAASNALGPVRAPEVDYYLGVCQLLNGHPQHAVAPLQRVAAANKSRLVPAAHLYLAKAYLQQGKLNEAQMHLELATTRPGALKSEATALLARLKLLRQSMEESGTTPVP
jgi:lipopolysaccharide biosynthesis regulator YciM